MITGHHFTHCHVGIDTEGTAGPDWPDLGIGYAITTFPDGSTSDARPHLTEHYRRTAERAGYGTGPGAITGFACEHELAHIFVSEALGQRFSPTLYAQAHRAPSSLPWTADEVKDWIAPEERIVKAFQALVNGVRYARQNVQPLVDAGCDLDALAGEWDRLIIQMFGSRKWWEQDSSVKES